MSSSGSEPAMKSFNGGFIHELLSMNYSLEKLTKIDTLLKCLEEEQRKIDNFKRELPFSMALLNDAIGVLRQELKQCRPVLEEFMPINKKPVQENEDLGFVKERDCEKMNWMSSAQLWSDHKRADDLKEDKAGSDRAPLKPFSRYRSGGTGGAFLPFKSNQREVYKAEKDKKVEKEEKIEKVDLSLASGTKNLSSNCSTGLNLKAKKHPVPETDSQIQRKARRCWSPELHRRFLRALQELGGSHAATPKQIRQLMKVDGLTNDEVKSHLQKYRLHRRSGVSDNDGVSGNSGVSGKTKQVVLMGGIWGPSKQSPDQSGSPQGPLQFAGNGRGDSGEDEDGKSDGYTSWKSHIQMSGEETD